ncbi:GH-E family nuclease, partial [Clostridium sp. HBUAS56017]|uniref:GH-E family nuclease n=1 Tax=Clostridium sp. HBUAS56017 TaxID=2571128 RepID=UPI001A9AD793
IEIPEEFQNYEDYLLSEEEAEKYLNTEFLGMNLSGKIYFGDEANEIPPIISYRKNGNVYIYSLRELIVKDMFGNDIVPTDEELEFFQKIDPKYLGKYKQYSYERIFTDEIPVSIGIVDASGLRGIGNPKPLENGPYIKNGKPNGRPTLSGEKKLQFEKDVYNNNVDPDGILRDPNEGDIIDWKPGQPRKDVVDFGHKSGYGYKDMFEKYKNGKITLDELKEFQFNQDNYRLETPSANRKHIYE